MSEKPKAEEKDWEKEHAPVVTRGRMVFSILLYLGWIGFLAYFTYDRWYGTLQ